MAQGRHSSSIFAKPLVLIGGGVAAVVAIGLLIFVLVGGGTGGLLPGGDGSPTDTVSISPLGWQVSAPFPVPTNLDAKPPESQQAADRAGRQVVDVLEDLYTSGFLDAEALTSGDYSATFEVFAGGARPEARRREAVLTAGPGAEVFDRIEPTEGRVQMKVLLGANGQPVSVVGVVAFEAEAFGDEGGVRFVSQGQYFLEPVGGTWRIISFDVRRRDVKLRESPTPSTSATPSGSASATGGGTQ